MTVIQRPDKIPEWASVDQNDPSLPIPNVVEPPASKKQAGWYYKEPPPANWFNWLQRYYYKWIAFFDDQRTNQNPVYAIDISATANIISINLSPAILEYTDGRLFIIRINNTSTGASTLSVNGLPEKTIIDLDEKELVGGELLANGLYMFVYSALTDVFYLQSKPSGAGWLTGDHMISSRKDYRAGFITYTKDETIGDASSAASLLASASAEDLFKFLWNNYDDGVCPVDGGRGASADADWVAHKRIHIFPHYDRVFASAGITSGPPGLRMGSWQQSLGEGNNGQHAHGNSHGAINTGRQAHADGSIPTAYQGSANTEYSGGGVPFSIVQPAISINIYVKL